VRLPSRFSSLAISLSFFPSLLRCCISLSTSGAGRRWAVAAFAEAEQTEMVNTLIQKTVLLCIDAQIPGEVIESFLLYFWFRCTVNRYGLPEAFFQKVERHWDEAIDQVNGYMDAQAAADRRQV
jgi:hypothetical protein